MSSIFKHLFGCVEENAVELNMVVIVMVERKFHPRGVDRRGLELQSAVTLSFKVHAELIDLHFYLVLNIPVGDCDFRRVAAWTIVGRLDSNAADRVHFLFEVDLGPRIIATFSDPLLVLT